MKIGAKRVLGAVLLVGIIWAIVITYWQYTHRVLSQADIVEYLIILPLLAVVSFIGLSWAWHSSGQKVAAATATAVPTTGASAPPATDASAATQAAERGYTFQVLNQWVQTAAGQDAATVWQAVQTNEVHPKPDEELQDEDGLPLLSTRYENLDVKSIQQGLTALPEVVTLLDKQPIHPRLLRSLALLNPIDTWLADGLAVWVDGKKQLQAHTPINGSPATPVLPAFCVALVLPAMAHASATPPSEGDQAAAHDSVLKLAKLWLAPQLGALPDFDPRVHALKVRTTHSPIDSMAWADYQLLSWHREGRPGLLLLLVADSLLDEAWAAELQQRAILMHGRQPKGSTLGEAAVGLLLATRDWPALSSEAEVNLESPVLLHRWAYRRREKSADDGGRISPEVARETLGDALQASGIAGSEVAAAVCDLDLRSSRTTEWYGALLQHMGHLDTSQDVTALGVALGDCGAAHAALCVALAAYRARSEQQIVAATSVSASYDRGAVILRPAQPAPSEVVAQA